MQLADKRIIVTGGASGIAAAAVRAYVREGARVVSLDVNDADGARIAAEAGPAASYLHCDVARRAAVVAAFTTAVERLGGLDVVANVAAIERSCPAEDIDEAAWDEIFAVNVKGTVFTNQAAFPHLQANGGVVINFSSGAAIRGQPGSAHYAASKGAVMSWTRTVAQEWAKFGIRMFNVVPAIWTPMYDRHRARMAEHELAIHDMAMRHVIPLGGKLGDPDHDMAPVMVFLASDASRFMTGQSIIVDGGMIMR